MIDLIAEKEKGSSSEPVLFTQVVDNIGYLLQDQFYLEAGVLERAAQKQGCDKLRAVLVFKDEKDAAKNYADLKGKGFVPVDVILGGIYVLEKRII